LPIAYLDLPSGLEVGTKRKLVKEVADSIHDAYMIPDTRVFLREWPSGQTSVEGHLGSPMRPICDFVVPPGLPLEAKRQLVKRVSSAIAEACNLSREEVLLPSGKKVGTKWVLAFFREVTLEQAALDDLMAFENPMVLESMEAALQNAKVEQVSVSYDGIHGQPPMRICSERWTEPAYDETLQMLGRRSERCAEL
jgi:phenylpyruvate tautomerase PptA (4-oxalocrotonate tautomerase family)